MCKQGNGLSCRVCAIVFLQCQLGDAIGNNDIALPICEIWTDKRVSQTNHAG